MDTTDTYDFHPVPKYAVADLQRPLLQAEPVHPRVDLGADGRGCLGQFKSLNGESQ
jgi:hypothetical protein